MKQKMTFALCFCNRGFMPGELIYGARDDMVKAVTDAGYDYIMMDKELTRYGGVETRDEGLLYAKWLKEHEGQYDGVIFSMPISPTKTAPLPPCRTRAFPSSCRPIPMRSARWTSPTAAMPTAASSPSRTCSVSTMSRSRCSSPMLSIR